MSDFHFKTIKRILYFVVAVFSLSVLNGMLTGNISFSATIFLYSFLIWLLLRLTKFFRCSTEVRLLGVSVALALFFVEVALRFFLSSTLTYSESKGGVYSSPYDLQFKGERFSSYFKLNPRNFHDNRNTPLSYRNFNAPEYDYGKEQINAFGFRGMLADSQKAIIGFFGDSYTESVGAPPDSTLPVLFKKHLNPSLFDYDVFNAGISGNDPFFEFKALQMLDSFYIIKHAFFVLNESDLSDVTFRGGKSRFLENGKLKFRKSPPWEILYASSHVFRLIAETFFSIQKNLMTQEEYVLERQKSLAIIIRHFNEDIIPWCRAKDIEVHITVLPIRYDFPKKSEDFKLMEIKISALKQAHFHSIYFALNQHENIKDLYWEKDGHFKPKGYDLAAKYLAQSWEKNQRQHCH